MKKYNLFNSGLLSAVAIFAFIITISSCGARKNNRKLDIERLFMQTTQPEITFSGAGGLEGMDGSRSVSEEVTFSKSYGDLSNNEVMVDELDQKLDTTKTYRLSGVVVKAKSNFATERDGKVHVDFDIIAPVDVLDPYWRLTLAPFLVDGDSITPLDTVYVTGEGFRDKQLGDLDAYQDFLNTIVDPEAYDSLFVDYKNMNKEIYKVQRRNYNDYRRNYDLMMDYENWKKMNEMEYLRMEAIARRHKLHVHEHHWRKAEKKALNQLSHKKDTTGIYAHHMEKYRKEYTNYLKRQFSFDWLNEELTPDINIHAHKDSIMRRSHIPKKYREIHQNGLTLRSLPAKPFTKEDSARIAKHHYLIDEIVLNDMNIERRGEIYNEVVEFPIPEEGRLGMRLDTITTAEYDFRYPYKQPWKIEKGTKKLEVVMAAMVEGVDRSTFVFPLTDTLTYFIASLAQLADESMVTERKMLHKSMVDNQSVYPDYRTRKSSKFKDIKNPDIFDKILDAYKIYNEQKDLVVDSITVRAFTDLTGMWHENYELSQERAIEVADYLKQKGVRHVATKAAGEDWPTLAKQIQAHKGLLYRQAILDSLANAVFPDMTEENIQRDFPDDFKIIKNEIYPKLNRLDITLHINRPAIDGDTLQETYREDYAEGIRLLREKEYMEALELLAKYADYNTALALVCLGYNDKAEEVLDALPESGRNEYLLAIVTARTERKNEAVKHLQKACELSPELYNRTRLDSEVRDLADEFNLWETLKN